MAEGKHASRSKSFDDFEYNRRGSSRRGRREQIVGEEISEEDKLNVHNDILNANSDNYEDNYDDDDYYDDEPMINYKKVIIIVVAILLVVAVTFGIYKLVKSKENAKIDNETTKAESMPLSIAGYKVLGQIIIKDLNVEQYILNLAEDDALKNGVVKLYGSSLNSIGNMCIAGHNHEGVFKDIGKLNVGNKIILKDISNVEHEYKVTSVKTVEPDDLECLLQNNERVEITLITCSEDSTSRVIVKAEKVTKDNG